MLLSAGIQWDGSGIDGEKNLIAEVKADTVDKVVITVNSTPNAPLVKDTQGQVLCTPSLAQGKASRGLLVYVLLELNQSYAN